MNCPKCGFEQPEAAECARCGVVFAKLPRSGAYPDGETAPPAAVAPPPSPTGFPGAAAPAGGWGGSGVGAGGGGGAAGQGGQLYGGPQPGLTGGGQLYGGPPPGGGGFVPRAPGGPTFGLTTVSSITAGSLIKDTLSIYFGNFGAFIVISLLAHLLTLVQLSLRKPTDGKVSADLGIYLALSFLLALLASGLTTAGVTFGVLQRLRGRAISIGECLQQGLGAVVPVFLVALLQALLCGLSLAACVVPFLFVWPMLSVAVPAAVEERPGAVAALRRSAYLTEGYRGSIFGAFLLLGFLFTILGGGASVLITRMLGGGSIATTVSSYVLGSVTGGMTATAAAIVYYRLRAAKESIDLGNLASVFD